MLGGRSLVTAAGFPYRARDQIESGEQVMISRFRKTRIGDESGFTLIEILMVIILISILAVGSLELFSDSANDSRYQETLNRMNQVREALIGNPDLKVDGARSSFGFVGDIGALPDSGTGLQALMNNSTGLGVFTARPDLRLTYGWNGPYLGIVDITATTVNDGWGRPLLYDAPTSFQATLTSYGADGAAGGTGLNQDVLITIPESLTSATLVGFVCQNSGPFDGEADIEVNYPDGDGNLSQVIQHVSVGMNGSFNFFTVPFGIRSITVYVPDKGSATKTKGPSTVIIDKPNFLVPCSLVDVGGP